MSTIWLLRPQRNARTASDMPATSEVAQLISWPGQSRAERRMYQATRREWKFRALTLTAPNSAERTSSEDEVAAHAIASKRRVRQIV